MTTNELLKAQGADNVPTAAAYDEGTNLIVAPTSLTDRLRHFSEEMYDTSPESHISRLAKAFLGDAGAGRLRKLGMMGRLQTSIYGTHFYDLDRFYGALFGAQRRLGEALGINPYTDIGTEEEWDQIRLADDSYRTRMEQLARAITYGGSATGMRLIAEALLSVECDIYESWYEVDHAPQTVDDVVAIGNVTALSAYTLDELSGSGLDAPIDRKRSLFTIVPKRQITEEERYDLLRVIRIFKPAWSMVRVDPDGPVIHREVPLSSVASDSEYWQIESRKLDGASLDQSAIKRPPFSGYQGEAYSHLGQVAGVTSYGMDTGDNVVLSKNFDVEAFPLQSGKLTYISYTPELALSDIRKILAGRSVSDGILSAHPFFGAARGTLANPDNAPAGGPPLDTYGGLLIEGQPIGDHNLNTDYYHKQRQEFWATPARPQTDGMREVVEVRFRSTILVNYLTLDIARFPHNAYVEVFDQDLGEWVQVAKQHIGYSFPQKITRRNSLTDQNLHPQHSVAGHWATISARVDPVRTSRIRVILVRSPASAPVDAQGNDLPYSLAVRNLDLGYRITTRADIPEPDETLGGGFATTINAAGETVVLTTTENRAESLLDASGNIWMSEPMPTNRAVVNLYVDARTPDGQAQVLDRFFLDPVKSGPNINLYWSDQETFNGAFETPHEKLSIQTDGVVEANYTGEVGLSFGDSDGTWAKIDNADLQWDPAISDWYLALTYIARSASATTDERILFSAGDIKVSVVSDTIVLTTAGGSTYVDLTVVAGDKVAVLLNYTAVLRTISIQGMTGDDTSEISEIHLVDGPVRPSDLYFGGEPGHSIPANMVLKGALLKLAEAPTGISAYYESINQFTLLNGDHKPWNSDNSILRFHPSFLAHTWSGFRGGVPNLLDVLSWHPVERDYRLLKGYINLPPVRAKFWKFEFTNLVPEMVESFLPIVRRVRMFPTSVANYGISNSSPLSTNAWAFEGRSSGSTVGGYRDLTAIGTTADKNPTTAAYAPNPQVQLQRRKQAWLYGMQPWQVGGQPPRFHETGPHEYVNHIVLDNAKLAFFVGLRQIVAYRLDHAATDDTAVYREHFHDLSHIESTGTWDFASPDTAPKISYDNLTGIYTIEGEEKVYTTLDEARDRQYALSVGLLSLDSLTDPVVTSKVYESRHKVRALQFATSQSDARQLVPDDDFTDSSLPSTGFADPSRWHSFGDGVLSYSATDNTVLISRDIENVRPVIPAEYPTTFMGSPFGPVFAFTLPEDATPLSQEDGGIESPEVTPSNKGMLHAAVRVTALTDTSDPLRLQIIGSDDTVLSEKIMFLHKGETKEWVTRLQLGYYPRVGAQLWEDLPEFGSPFGPVWPDIGDGPDPSGETQTYTPDERVRVRLVQQGGSSADSWKVDRLSLFDETVLWEFSVDGGESFHEALNIRNNPDGVISFPQPGSQLVWRATGNRENASISAIQIRPWYVNDLSNVLGIPDRGPNISAFDHEPPITKDPEFMGWFDAVPYWWWMAGQRFPDLPADGQPLISPSSRSYARAGEDVLPEPTDDPGSVLTATRTLEEVLDEPLDSGDPTVSLSRSYSEVVPEPGGGGTVTVFHSNDDPLIAPPFGPMEEDD